MTLPKDNPKAFCKAFILRELENNKKREIWMSYWPTMKRLADRADELESVFNEIVDSFGYSDKYEGVPPSNTYVWLILEHVWFSSDFCREDVVDARVNFRELNEIKDTIVELSSKLAFSLRRQDELYERSGFQRSDYQAVDDMIELASSDNYLFQSYLSDKLKALSGQYDLKYWPSRADVVEAISDFEVVQPCPRHFELPSAVINGRASDIKDFVLAFDGSFDNESNGLPVGFRFSNKAMAEIINIVLNLSSEKLASPDAIKTVRNRYSESNVVNWKRLN